MKASEPKRKRNSPNSTIKEKEPVSKKIKPTRTKEQEERQAFKAAAFIERFPEHKTLSEKEIVRARTMWYTLIGIRRIVSASRRNFMQWSTLKSKSKNSADRLEKLKDLYEIIECLRGEIRTKLTGKPVKTYPYSLDPELENVPLIFDNSLLTFKDSSSTSYIRLELRDAFVACGPPEYFETTLLRTRKSAKCTYIGNWEGVKEEAIKAYSKLYSKTVRRVK